MWRLVQHPLALTISWLELEHIGVAFGTRPALRDVTVSLGPGVTALLGRNGAGKTTLCRVVAGHLHPDTGVVRLGHGIHGPRSSQAELSALGWLPQSLKFPGSMRVWEAVRYAAWLKGLSSAEATARAQHVLREVDLEDRVSTRCRELSGGMERRLGLATALAADPPGLILDEPSAGLDPLQRDQLHGLIRGLSGARGILLSTHLLEDVAGVAESVVVLDEGHVLFAGSVDDLGGGQHTADALRAGLLHLLGSAT
ncbi:MAG: ATP-binding cassette domain-containing protein [Dermatophilaceae bacterium]